MGKFEILLGLTTTPGSDWKEKVKEMKKFGIKRIALFPTFLEIGDRKILYKLLEDIDGLQVPHVHLRQDMEKWELELFEEKYGTEVFNIHGKHFAYYKREPFERYLPKIYIENQFYGLSRENLKECGGLCIDFSHLESAKIKKLSVATEVEEMAKEFKIGCCHISAIKGFFSLTNFIQLGGRDSHMLSKLDEVDYLRKYKEYLPKYLSIELENSFEKQLEVKKYLEENVLFKI